MFIYSKYAVVSKVVFWGAVGLLCTLLSIANVAQSKVVGQPPQPRATNTSEVTNTLSVSVASSLSVTEKVTQSSKDVVSTPSFLQSTIPSKSTLTDVPMSGLTELQSMTKDNWKSYWLWMIIATIIGVVTFAVLLIKRRASAKTKFVPIARSKPGIYYASTAPTQTNYEPSRLMSELLGNQCPRNICPDYVPPFIKGTSEDL